MKKILSIVLVGILILSGIQVVAITSNTNTDVKADAKSEMIIKAFSTPTIKDSDNSYIEVNLKDASSYLMSPGQPKLPKVVESFELPFGAKNIKVEVAPGTIVEQKITKEICPAPAMLPLIADENTVSFTQEKDLKTYSSDDPYPSNWYSYNVRCGLNKDNERVINVIVDIYPVRYVPSKGIIYTTESSDIKITYEETDRQIFNGVTEYDLVIIAPSKFKNQLKRLVDHKNSVGISTFIKTTEEIYKEYSGRDKPEKIKYFIKDAIEKNNIIYVLLVGGLKSQIYAKPRDDANQGTRGWYVPVRYTNLYDNPKFPLAEKYYDPGIISDLYYADIYDGNGNFSSWDTNNDDIFAAWGKPGVKNDTGIDLQPDVCLGRLACTSRREVKTVVDKIIKYETSSVSTTDWFNKMTVVSGDGFIDQQDLNIKWDTTGLINGYYTIYAQSINDENLEGPVDTISIRIDRRLETKITFNHDDNLNPALKNGYPAPPIAELVSISPDDILGYSDYTYTPNEGEAYGNDFNHWANISYIDGILTIRGKSYDPQPYGNLTNIHVWIKNQDGIVIFSEWRNNTEMYYEGEWTTGEKELSGRGGALYYIPSSFERNILWTSNGRLTGQKDVLKAINEGCGFLFMSGHGSPNVWADHYPGVPGNRKYGSVTGLQVSTVKPWRPFYSRPAFPIDTLSNDEKLPIAVIGGCHNSQFNVSLIPALYDILPTYLKFLPKISMWTYGSAVPECFSWRLISNPHGGAIATIGNTGLGYGMPGKDLTIGGGDGWITIEFFKQYGTENQTILGKAHTQTIISYIHNFDMNDLEAGHPKTVQQWVLLGDPTLKIGGYS